MLSRFRPNHATVVAYLALFVALGGTSAYAVNEWTGANIVDESLTGGDVRGKAGTGTAAAVNGSLTGVDISGQPANAGNGTPYVNGSLTSWDLADGSVARRDIAPDAIDSGNVVDDTLTGDDIAPDAIDSGNVVGDTLTGADILESSLGTVPSASNAGALGGRPPSGFLSAATKWKSLDTIGERYPVEIGNPACSGNRLCTATLRCDSGDVLLSGGFNMIDNDTRLWAAFPFNANGYDQKYLIHWENNSTADTVRLVILCADQ